MIPRLKLCDPLVRKKERGSETGLRRVRLRILLFPVETGRHVSHNAGVRYAGPQSRQAASLAVHPYGGTGCDTHKKTVAHGPLCTAARPYQNPGRFLPGHRTCGRVSSHSGVRSGEFSALQMFRFTDQLGFEVRWQIVPVNVH